MATMVPLAGNASQRFLPARFLLVPHLSLPGKTMNRTQTIVQKKNLGNTRNRPGRWHRLAASSKAIAAPLQKSRLYLIIACGKFSVLPASETTPSQKDPLLW
jgi:hypothetical protein